MPTLAPRAIAAVASLVSPAFLGGQAATAPRAVAPADSPAITAIKVDGRQLHAGTWRYTMQATGNGQTQSVTRELTVAATTLGGAPVWIVADAKGDGATRVADSLYLTRDDLLPLRHSLRMGALTVLVNYSRDSVLGQATLPQGSAKIAVKNVRGSMASGTMFEVYLRMMPLKTGWKGNMAMSAIGPKGNLIIPVAIEVSGEETVTVPAGTFPCFVVSITGQGTQQKAWISKAGRDIVKVTASFSQPSGASLETVLVSKR